MCLLSIFAKVAVRVLNSAMLIVAVLLFLGGVFLKSALNQVLNTVNANLSTLKVSSIQLPHLAFLTGYLWILLVIGGVIMAVAAVMGLLATYMPGLTIIKVYVVLASLLSLTSFILGFLLLIPESAVHKQLKNICTELLKEQYNKGRFERFTDVIDNLQCWMNCCGINGPEDYTNGSIPSSCCDKNNPTTNNSDNGICKLTTQSYDNQTNTKAMDTENLATDNCTLSTGNTTQCACKYVQKGCYEKMTDKIIRSDAVIVGYAFFILIQVTNAVLGAVYMFFKSVDDKAGVTKPVATAL